MAFISLPNLALFCSESNYSLFYSQILYWVRPTRNKLAIRFHPSFDIASASLDSKKLIPQRHLDDKSHV
jgi:hypothetical protein